MIEYTFHKLDNTVFGKKGYLNLGKLGRKVIFSGYMNHIFHYSSNNGHQNLIAKFNLKSWK